MRFRDVIEKLLKTTDELCRSCEELWESECDDCRYKVLKESREDDEDYL